MITSSAACEVIEIGGPFLMEMMEGKLAPLSYLRRLYGYAVGEISLIIQAGGALSEQAHLIWKVSALPHHNSIPAQGELHRGLTIPIQTIYPRLSKK